MELTTNSNNPAGLKVLITSLKTKTKVGVNLVELPPEGRMKRRLPLFKIRGIAEETEIFDMNAAVIYIMETNGIPVSQSLEKYQHFESHYLGPAVTSYLNEKDKDHGILQDLTKNLTTIEKVLESQKFVAGSSAGFEDIILWSCLFPLVGGKDKVMGTFPKTNEWFARLQGVEYFANAVKKLKPSVGKDGTNISLSGNPTAPSSTFGDRAAKIEPQNGTEADDEKIVLAEDLKAARAHWQSPVLGTSPKIKKSGVILPQPGQKNYLVSSALPYVNNVPHLGNIIGCVLSADVFARYCRLRGRNTFYVCGTDEYGTATETKALEEKLTPQQICDKYHKLHDEIYKWFNISFDYFGRTTTQHQTTVGQDIFMRLHANGFLKELPVLQCFCVPCQRFLSDRFVEGTCPSCGYDDARGDQCDKCGRLTNSVELKNPRCKVCHSSEVVTKSSDQVFLDLPLLVEKENLDEWVEKASEAWTPNARHIVRSWIREGLRERCITRDLKWGTPVPLERYKDKVFYVWFDAPIGYISITANYTSNWKQWWINPEADIDYYQFMAKDNVPFHGILFPASLLGTKQPWTTVKHLIATEYLNYEDGKFSKSRGYGVFGNDAKDTGIPADIWRFYLLYLRPENQDSAFCWDDFMTKNNSELLNNLGNFINRSLSFLEKFFESTVPAMELTEEDFNVVAQINQDISNYVAHQELCKMRDALRQILSISKIGNQYFQSQKPWTLNKNEKDKPRCSTICGLGVQIVYLIATLLEPFMPQVSQTIREQMNVTTSVFTMQVQRYLEPGHKIGKVKPLFQKLEPALIDSLRKKYGGPQVKVE